MARNRSELQPPRDPTWNSKFYKVLEADAKSHWHDETTSRQIRENIVNWAVAAGSEIFDSLRSIDGWTDNGGDYKRNYVADYLDYLYATSGKHGTQSK